MLRVSQFTARECAPHLPRPWRMWLHSCLGLGRVRRTLFSSLSLNMLLRKYANTLVPVIQINNSVCWFDSARLNKKQILTTPFRTLDSDPHQLWGRGGLTAKTLECVRISMCDRPKFPSMSFFMKDNTSLVNPYSITVSKHHHVHTGSSSISGSTTASTLLQRVNLRGTPKLTDRSILHQTTFTRYIIIST